jgi:hypothetical protein
MFSVPPKILPINPMTGLLREGMRAAITCQIMEGDLPITFRWERNGKAVSNNAALGTVIRRIDEFSSSLIIEQVTSAHTGNYTCIASNVAGAEKHVVPLTVNGKSAGAVPSGAAFRARRDDLSSVGIRCSAPSVDRRACRLQRGGGTRGHPPLPSRRLPQAPRHVEKGRR